MNCRTFIYKAIFAILFVMADSWLFAQPYDLLFPTEESPDSLTKEVRDLHDIERDLALEKMTREPNKVDAYIELADLRRRQGKLQEAKRFYEMALKLSPDNYLANQGLMLTHYLLGEFHEARDRMDNVIQLDPLSLDEKSEFNRYRQKLQDEARVGVSIYEDDRDLNEIMYFGELNFKGKEYRKLRTNLRYEKWTFEEAKAKEHVDVFLGSMYYDFDDNTNIMGTFAPEMFEKNDSIKGFSFEGSSGTDNLRIALKYSYNGFRENLFTIRNRYEEKNTSISIYGDLHPRTRLIQNISLSEISDDNSKRRYDTEIIHSIFKKKAPFMTASIRFYQSSYEFQTDTDGNFLNYWAPSDYKGGELTLSWERSIGSKWWWGIDTKYTYNRYRFDTAEDVDDSGAGATLYVNYKIAGGDLYASIGDRINSYFRERRLDVQGSFSF